MAEGSIASGAVTITANADQLANGLNQAKGKVEKFGNETTKKLGETGKKSGAEFAKTFGTDLAQEMGRRGFAGGVLGGLIGGGLGGALSEVIANSLGELGVTDAINKSIKGFFEIFTGSQRAADAIASIADELKRAAAEQDKMLKSSAEWRTTMVETDDQVADIDKNIIKLNADWSNLEQKLLPRLSELHQMRHSGSITFGKKGQLVGEINELVNAQNAIFEKQNKLLEERRILLDPTKNLQLAQDIAKATIGLREQAVTWGLSGDAAQRASFQFRGATNEMLKGFDAQRKINEQLAITNSLTPGLMFALNAAGRIAHQMAPQNLPGWTTMLWTIGQIASALPQPVGIQDWIQGALGGTQGPAWLTMVLGNATAIANEFDKITDKGTQFAGALERGSQEAHSVIVRSQFGPDRVDSTTAAVKQLKTPLERAAERLDQINNKLGDIEQV